MSRVLTSLVLIPVVVWLIFFAPYAVFWGAIIVFAVLCYREYLELVRARSLDSMAIPGYVFGLLMLAELARYTVWLTILLAVAGLALALRSLEPRVFLATAGAFVLGVLYIFGAWSSALSLRQASAHWMFFAVAVNWAGDASAYYAGRAFGKRKLMPRISPAKTVEGAMASLAAGLLFGILYLGWALPGVPLWQRAGIAIAANIAGQCGDLAESALKRGAGVKDSGTMLPGHGGWLDRLDSSLFSMPVVAALLSLLK